MNKLSSLDVRIAILAYPLVAKEDVGVLHPVRKAISSISGNDRIVSVFLNSPKASIEPTPSRLHPVIRKGQFYFWRLQEIFRAPFQNEEKATLASDISSPRQLRVPQLPDPVFRSHQPPRFFWHPAYEPPKDEYAPGCLMSEAKEDLPRAAHNAERVCAQAKNTLPLKGILRQASDGFVYLELPDPFIFDLFPLIGDQKSEPVPLYLQKPSLAHIPVILPHEWAQKKGWGEIQKLDTFFTFEIKTLCSLCPKRWPGVEKVYFLTVQSKELEALRENHLLPSRIRGHDFHVAIAIKRTAATAPHATGKELFRLNVSCFAA